MAPQRFHIISIEFFLSFPCLLPLRTNDLFCHEVGYFCCLSLPFFTFTSTVLAERSLDYGDELPQIPLPPLWFLAARMGRLMDKYVGGLANLTATNWLINPMSTTVVDL